MSRATSSQMKALPDVCTSIPVIVEELLQEPPCGDKVIGTGCFGTCTKLIYKDMFQLG